MFVSYEKFLAMTREEMNATAINGMVVERKRDASEAVLVEANPTTVDAKVTASPHKSFMNAFNRLGPVADTEKPVPDSVDAGSHQPGPKSAKPARKPAKPKAAKESSTKEPTKTAPEKVNCTAQEKSEPSKQEKPEPTMKEKPEPVKQAASSSSSASTGKGASFMDDIFGGPDSETESPVSKDKPKTSRAPRTDPVFDALLHIRSTDNLSLAIAGYNQNDENGPTEIGGKRVWCFHSQPKQKIFWVRNTPGGERAGRTLLSRVTGDGSFTFACVKKGQGPPPDGIHADESEKAFNYSISSSIPADLFAKAIPNSVAQYNKTADADLKHHTVLDMAHQEGAPKNLFRYTNLDTLNEILVEKGGEEYVLKKGRKRKAPSPTTAPKKGKPAEKPSPEKKAPAKKAKAAEKPAPEKKAPKSTEKKEKAPVKSTPSFMPKAKKSKNQIDDLSVLEEADLEEEDEEDDDDLGSLEDFVVEEKDDEEEEQSDSEDEDGGGEDGEDDDEENGEEEEDEM